MDCLPYPVLTTTWCTRHYYCVRFTEDSTEALRKGHRDSEHGENSWGNRMGIERRCRCSGLWDPQELADPAARAGGEAFQAEGTA